MALDGESAAENVIWHVDMLGRLRAHCVLPHANVTLEQFQTQKTGMLFALLVLHYGAGSPATPLYRDDLAARLWPDADQDAGRDRLSQALSWLRRNLEASVGLPGNTVLQADRRTVRLAPDAVSSDAAMLESLFKKARTLIRRDAGQAAALLGQAIALYEGALLPGIAEADDDLLLERQRLEAVFQDMARQAALAEALLGHLPSAIDYARRLLQIDAGNDADCGLLMRLLTQAGDAGGALRVYGEFAARLSAQNAPLPDALRRLAQEIQQARQTPATGDSTLSAPAALPPASAPSPVFATVLPLPLTRYFGREREVNLLQNSLQAHETRLLTLLGPGGTGKTRLAVEAARRFIAPAKGQEQDEGRAPARAAFFVSLENAPNAAQIMPAIFRALGQAASSTAQEDGGQQETPHEDGPRLRGAVARLLGAVAHPLLVLDNCEHLAGSAEVVNVLADLLLRVPALSILATSRVRLGVDGEQQLLVPPLPSPHQALKQGDAAAVGAEQDALLAYPSVQMFLDRARRARLDFALSHANRDTIATLCQKLEGIPLAIELCAGWAATLAPREMLAALDNRFDLLVSRRPDVPPRHRSLYAAVESSYLQLSPELQAAFCSLSLFRGGWSAEAARAVVSGSLSEDKAADSLVRNSLAALQERSLIFTESGPDGSAAMRWRMLETLREFAYAQLGAAERQAAAASHAAWFTHWAESIAPRLSQPGQREWLDMLEAEQDNFQAALATLRAVQGPQEVEAAFLGLRLCIALDRFWLTRGYSRVASEHLAWFLPLAANASPDAPRRALLARGYTALGRAFAAQGELPAALAPLETALETWRNVGDAAGLAGAQMDLGEVCYWVGRKQEALTLLTESETAARQAGEALLCGAVLLTLGSIALDEQDIARAERLHEEALAFARQKDNRRLMARILCNLGEIAREQGQLEKAGERGRQALAAAEVGDQAAGCYIRLSLGRVACDAGDPGKAGGYVRDCLRYVSKAGTRRLLMLCLLLAARIASMQSQQERCAVLLGAGSGLRDEVSVRLIQGEAEEEAALVTAARQALGEAAYEAAYGRGMALPLEAALTYALDGGSAPPA